jgi:hypothetical protein
MSEILPGQFSRHVPVNWKTYEMTDTLHIRHEYDDYTSHRLVAALHGENETVELSGPWASYDRIASVRGWYDELYEGQTDYFGERVAFVKLLPSTKKEEA